MQSLHGFGLMTLRDLTTLPPDHELRLKHPSTRGRTRQICRPICCDFLDGDRSDAK